MNPPLTPHGPGFRFLESFEIISPGKGVARLLIKPDLWFFQDHFPGQPLMPAALLIECAAQAAGVLWMHGQGAPETPLFVASVDQFRVLNPVLPGELLETSVTLLKELGSIAQFESESRVGEKTATRGRITLSRKLL
jgi:3-hydroxyacyl-[acyl-carrier-protein] dehydratase